MNANERNTTPSEGQNSCGPLIVRGAGGTGRSCSGVQGLDRLARTMEVQVIALSNCLIGPGFALDLDGRCTPSFCYLRKGHGRLDTRNEAATDIGPHTMIMVPPHCAFKFQAEFVDALAPDRTQDPAMMLCGTFRCLRGNSTDVFDTLRVPVVEQFSRNDTIERKLRTALAEHIARKPCSDVVVSTEIKQVIVTLIRRSLRSQQSWMQRFVNLIDAESGSHVPTQLHQREELR